MTYHRSLMLAAVAALALAAQPATAQTKWNLPAAYPADNPHSENLALFAKDVGDATGGKLAITVHPAASLFKAPDIKRAVQTGQTQIGEVLMSLHENEDPIFGIDVVPFLASSFPESQKLYLASKPAVEKKLAAQGLMLLFVVPWAPQGIYANKEINSVADMKGLKWRSYNAAQPRSANWSARSRLPCRQLNWRRRWRPAWSTHSLPRRRPATTAKPGSR